MTDVLNMDPFVEIAPYPDDNIVYPDYAQRAFEAYSKRRAPDAIVCLEMIEGGAHGFSKKHDALAIEKLGCFLQN